MKLLTKINLYYLGITLVLFLCAIGILVYTVHYIINHEVEERLFAAKEEVTARLNETDSIPEKIFTIGDLVKLKKLDEAKEVTRLLPDTMIYNLYEGENIPYHRIQFSAEIHGQPYLITVSKSHVEEEDIYESVITAIALLFLVLLALLFIFNRWLFRRTWRPFYQTLSEISTFDLQQKEALQVNDGNITEFKELNNILYKMTEKMRADFLNLKEFTENASHEIQTPLAIIRGKLELLLQSENLTQQQAEQIQAISGATSRLSSLNRTLLLLSKIENRQFVEEEQIDISSLIQRKFEAFEELILAKNLEVELELAEAVSLKMNPVLAESLFSNLIYNSIKHNVENGMIKVTLTPAHFRISNSGIPPETAPENYFKRFVKSGSAASHGLGLSIVKQICQYYDFEVSYHFKNDLHVLEVGF